MKKHITVRELVAALSGLDQEALVVMTNDEYGRDCSHAFCENAVAPPTIQPTTCRYYPGVLRYMLAPAKRMGNDYSPLLLPDVEEG
jgi:hypothetical protein